MKQLSLSMEKCKSGSVKGRDNLDDGDFFNVPKGNELKPVTADECPILMIELARMVNIEDPKGEITMDNSV